MAHDFQAIRKHAYTRANRMFTTFDRRKGILLETAQEWYPLAVPGLELGVEQISDGWKFDDDHRMLTPTVSQTTYSNGTRVIVNYGTTPFDFEGRTVPAGDWRRFDR